MFPRHRSARQAAQSLAALRRARLSLLSGHCGAKGGPTPQTKTFGATKAPKSMMSRLARLLHASSLGQRGGCRRPLPPTRDHAASSCTWGCGHQRQQSSVPATRARLQGHDTMASSPPGPPSYRGNGFPQHPSRRSLRPAAGTIQAPQQSAIRTQFTTPTPRADLCAALHDIIEAGFHWRMGRILVQCAWHCSIVIIVVSLLGPQASGAIPNYTPCTPTTHTAQYLPRHGRDGSLLRELVLGASISCSAASHSAIFGFRATALVQSGPLRIPTRGIPAREQVV